MAVVDLLKIIKIHNDQVNILSWDATGNPLVAGTLKNASDGLIMAFLFGQDLA